MVQTVNLVNRGLSILMVKIFPKNNKLISSQIQMNTFLDTTDERKRRRCDKNKHKAMKNTVDIY